MKERNTIIQTDGGAEALATVPLIVSASRATDIPAFYADWFFGRLAKGYVRRRNPFNGIDSYISFANTHFIVFWSKNPAPLLPYLSILKQRGIGCYIQYTLNDYEEDGLEPEVGPLNERTDTFRRFVDALGPGSVIWRFDPLILTDKLTPEKLMDKVCHIGDALKNYAEKLVFSFADIAGYKKVGRNLSQSGIAYREWDESTMREFARRLSDVNRERWNYIIASCAEEIDLSDYGIEHNRCIDPELIGRLAPEDVELQNFLYNARTDKGQRKACGCIMSKDIGAYNTCPHGCLYCYANTSPLSGRANYTKHLTTPTLDSII